MLAQPDGWVEMVEVNPPRLPSMTHIELRGKWQETWWGLRNFALGDPPTDEVENIFLLRKPA